jgi:hypothetical protein
MIWTVVARQEAVTNSFEVRRAAMTSADEASDLALVYSLDYGCAYILHATRITEVWRNGQRVTPPPRQLALPLK